MVMSDGTCRTGPQTRRSTRHTHTFGRRQRWVHRARRGKYPSRSPQMQEGLGDPEELRHHGAAAAFVFGGSFTGTKVNNTSAFRGVIKHRNTGRWEAHLWDNTAKLGAKAGRKRGKQVYLGGFMCEEAAARAYDQAAIVYFGPSANTNFPLADYQQDMAMLQTLSREDVVQQLRRSSSGFSRGASKYRGVTRHHKHGKWEARVGRVQGSKYLYLGVYDSEEEAAKAYDYAVLCCRGVAAITNFDVRNYLASDGQTLLSISDALGTSVPGLHQVIHLFQPCLSPSGALPPSTSDSKSSAEVRAHSQQPELGSPASACTAKSSGSGMGSGLLESRGRVQTTTPLVTVNSCTARKRQLMASSLPVGRRQHAALIHPSVTSPKAHAACSSSRLHGLSRFAGESPRQQGDSHQPTSSLCNSLLQPYPFSSRQQDDAGIFKPNPPNVGDLWMPAWAELGSVKTTEAPSLSSCLHDSIPNDLLDFLYTPKVDQQRSEKSQPLHNVQPQQQQQLQHQHQQQQQQPQQLQEQRHGLIQHVQPGQSQYVQQGHMQQQQPSHVRDQQSGHNQRQQLGSIQHQQLQEALHAADLDRALRGEPSPRSPWMRMLLSTTPRSTNCFESMQQSWGLQQVDSSEIDLLLSDLVQPGLV